MITLRKLSTAAKLFLILGPAILVSGCSTVTHTPTASTQAGALAQAEPGPDRLVRYCRRMAETNNLRIAIGVCKRALEAAPDNPEPVLILADAYTGMKRHKEAEEAYRFALAIDATNSAAHFGLGKLYLKESNLAEASLHLEAALTTAQNDPAIYNALGIAKDQLGDHATAQTFYHAGLAIEPENTALSNNLGVSLLLSERLDEGASVLSALETNQRPNMTRRHNLEAAQEAIAASQLIPVAEQPSSLEETDANSIALRSVRLVSAESARASGPLEAVIQTSTSHVQEIQAPESVKPRLSPPPKSTAPAQLVTQATKTVTNAAPAPVVTLTATNEVPSFRLEPEITPAPVMVVDFQTLPPLQPRKSAQKRPDLTEKQAEIVIAEPLPEAQKTLKNADKFTSLDLSRLNPRRKPQVPVDVVIVALPLIEPATSAVEEKSDPIIVSDIIHLPIDKQGQGDNTAEEPQIQTDEDSQHANRGLDGPQLSLNTASETKHIPDNAAPDSGVAEFDLPDAVTAPRTPAAPRLNPEIFVAAGATDSAAKAFDIHKIGPLQQLARHHESTDATVENEGQTGTKRGSDSMTPAPWTIDLASLPSQDQKIDSVQDREMPTDPDLPSLEWPKLIAIREAPPLPGREPHGERLLALMMLNRENFSTA